MFNAIGRIEMCAQSNRNILLHSGENEPFYKQLTIYKLYFNAKIVCKSVWDLLIWSTHTRIIFRLVQSNIAYIAMSLCQSRQEHQHTYLLACNSLCTRKIDKTQSERKSNQKNKKGHRAIFVSSYCSMISNKLIILTIVELWEISKSKWGIKRKSSTHIQSNSSSMQFVSTVYMRLPESKSYEMEWKKQIQWKRVSGRRTHSRQASISQLT